VIITKINMHEILNYTLSHSVVQNYKTIWIAAYENRLSVYSIVVEQSQIQLVGTFMLNNSQ